MESLLFFKITSEKDPEFSRHYHVDKVMGHGDFRGFESPEAYHEIRSTLRDGALKFTFTPLGVVLSVNVELELALSGIRVRPGNDIPLGKQSKHTLAVGRFIFALEVYGG